MGAADDFGLLEATRAQGAHDDAALIAGCLGLLAAVVAVGFLLALVGWVGTLLTLGFCGTLLGARYP